MHSVSSRPTLARLLGAVLIGLLLAPGVARAQDKPADEKDVPKAPAGTPAGEADDGLYACAKAKGRFKINLPADVELKDLVTWAFSFTCKNFIYDSRISGAAAKVTIKSPEAMTAQEAWRVFLVALRSMNLTVVPKGNILQIVEEAQAKDKPLPIYVKNSPGATDELVRVVLRPENLSVDDLAAVLTELKSTNGNVKSVPRAGVVLVTDYGTNVQQMANLMLAVDQAVAGEKLYMIRAKYADATELVNTLNEILGLKAGADGAAAPAPAVAPARGRAARRQAAAAAATKGEAPEPQSLAGDDMEAVEAAVPSKLIGDERTNAIIMLGSQPAFLRVKALVSRLDVSLDVEGGGRIHVYSLENADAEQLATTLTAVISGISQGPTGQGGATGNARPQRPAPPPGGEGGGTGGMAFEGQVRVTHDKPTNSLVIVSSPKDFLAVREVVRKLDTPRTQVYLEATIVEMSVSNSRRLGTTFHGGAPFGDGNILLGGAQHADFSSINLASVLSATGLIGGAVGAPLEGAEEVLGIGQSIPSFAVMFQALANSGLTNVLSSPHLVTKDNEEAEISVGQTVPTQSALVGGVGGQVAGQLPVQSIQRIDVALSLKVTPHIGSSETVSLDINLEVSDIDNPNFNGLGPSTSKRTNKGKIVVRDQESVVLGGLILDKATTSESKVPLLGDIPIVGYLFKFTSKTKEKRNLLVVLTPYIIRDQEDLARIVERRTREHQEFLASYSAFATTKYRPEMDYRRKRGLLDHMNRAVLRSEEEAKVLEELERQEIGFPDGPIDFTEPAAGEPAAEPVQSTQIQTTTAPSRASASAR